MRDLLGPLDEWSGDDGRVGLATVVRTAGSTPRPVGARLVVAGDGRMAGSVSGGCLEGAVVEEVLATMRGEAPPRVLEYGISDELGWSVGLSCGGTVDVFVQAARWRGDAVLEAFRDAVAHGRPAALLTVLDGPRAGLSAVFTDADVRGDLPALGGEPAAEAARARLATGKPGVEVIDGVRVFVDPQVPAHHLVVIGAVHIGSVLARLARATGHRVTVVDPRTAFLTEERFPDVDAMVARWPDEVLDTLGLGPRDAAVCLAHDPKFEDPALAALLRSPVGYIGAIGSRSTHGKRVARLRDAGFTDADIARVHSPVGLDLGATTPEEIAVAILAEVVAARHGRGGARLRETATSGAVPA